jgi:hypothetical protein
VTEEQKSVLRGRRYLLEKKAEGRPEKLGNSCQVIDEGETREKLAEEFKVSPRTIQNDAAFVEGLDAIAESRPDLPQSRMAVVISARDTSHNGPSCQLGNQGPDLLSGCAE